MAVDGVLEDLEGRFIEVLQINAGRDGSEGEFGSGAVVNGCDGDEVGSGDGHGGVRRERRARGAETLRRSEPGRVSAALIGAPASRWQWRLWEDPGTPLCVLPLPVERIKEQSIPLPEDLGRHVRK